MDGRRVVDAPFIVTMPAAIDATNVGLIRGRLSAAFLLGPRLVIADLSSTSFCDVAGVRLLLAARYQAAMSGAQLRLVLPPGSMVRRITVLLEADHLLAVYSTVEEASDLRAISTDPLAAHRPFALRPPSGGRDGSP